MKIGVIDNLPEGGAKRVVYEQVKGFSRKHQVLYITNTLTTQLPFDSLKIEIVRLPFKLPVYHGLTRFMTELGLWTGLKQDYQEAVRRFTEFGALVLLAHPDRYTQAPWVLNLTDKPRLYFAHEWFRLIYEPEMQPMRGLSTINWVYEVKRRQLLQDLDRRFVRAATGVMTTSHYNADHMQSAYGTQSSLIPPGVDTLMFRPADTPGDVKKDYFLFIGEKDTAHGYDLLESIRQVAVPELRINVVSMAGDGYRYSDDRLRDLYSGAAATLCFDRNEPFGLVPLESMASGTPVIAVNEGGYRETIDDGGTGYLCPRDPKLIYQLMKQLSGDSLLRVKMGENGRERVKRAFGWDTHIKQLEKKLEEFVS